MTEIAELAGVFAAREPGEHRQPRSGDPAAPPRASPGAIG